MTTTKNNIESKNNQEFFTNGKKYRCIKSVVMKKGGKTAFKAGNIYEQVGEPTHWVGWLRDEQGDRHAWPQPVYIADTVKTWGTKPEDIDPRLYFEPVEGTKETEDVKEAEGIKVGDRVKVKSQDTPADVTAISEDGKYFTVKFAHPVREFWTDNTMQTATYSRYGITRNYDRMTGEEIVGNAQYYAEQLKYGPASIIEYELAGVALRTESTREDVEPDSREGWGNEFRVTIRHQTGDTTETMTLSETAELLARMYQEEQGKAA